MSRCYWVTASDGCEFRAQFTVKPSQETIDTLDEIIHMVRELRATDATMLTEEGKE